MSPSQPNDPLIGRLVDGRYRVRARIARGGMATVYVATDLRLERRIALKVMHAHLSDDTVFQGRFIQEARAAARLADPHVVNVFDQGQDGELAYLVMEYLPGITLRELLKEQRRLTIAQTVTVMDAILSGLAAAHRADIVHRDVKPENVLLAEDGRIKIGDFGLARATTANTASGQQLMGTIAYLAPELVTRGTADARSDIYSLGIMLYEMLVGEQPYRGEQPMQIAFQHATESVPRPSAKNPAIPEQLDELVLWATEKDPEERPLDAQVMLERLREIEREIGVSPAITSDEPFMSQTVILDEYDTGGHTSVLPVTGATALGLGLGSTAPTPPVVVPDDNATRLRRVTVSRRRRGFISLLIVLVLAIGAAGTGWFFGSGPGSRVEVPVLSGLDYDAAETLLAENDLLANRVDKPHSTIAVGTVIDSTPVSGTQVDKGATVSVIVSEGPQEHTLGSFVGKTEDQAVAELKALEISAPVDNRIYEYSPDVAADVLQWLSIVPAVGGEASTFNCWPDGCTAFGGDTAKLYVSLGPFEDATGMSIEDARASLEKQQISISEEITEYRGDAAANQVIWMSGAPDGRNFRPGDEVQLVVSGGPFIDPSESPSMTLDQAKKTLIDQGLVVGDEIHEYSNSTAAGNIIAISAPPEGRGFRPGDVVNLTVSDGREPIVIPNLNGWTIRDAMNELERIGLSPHTELPDSFVPLLGNLWDTYTVGSMNPKAGLTVYAGDTVTIGIRS